MRYKVHGWVRLKAETESRALILIYESPQPRPLPFPRTLSALNITRYVIEVKFLERVPHGYASRSKEAIPKRLHLDSISIDSG